MKEDIAEIRVKSEEALKESKLIVKVVNQNDYKTLVNKRDDLKLWIADLEAESKKDENKSVANQLRHSAVIAAAALSFISKVTDRWESSAMSESEKSKRLEQERKEKGKLLSKNQDEHEQRLIARKVSEELKKEEDDDQKKRIESKVKEQVAKIKKKRGRPARVAIPASTSA